MLSPKILLIKAKLLHFQLFSCCLLSCLFFVPISFAQSLEEDPPLFLGPFDLFPTLDVDVRHDDNTFSDVNGSEVSSTLILVRPKVSAVADDGVIKYSIDYQLENGRYSGVSNSDYVDHQIDASVEWRIDIRHLLEFNSTIQRNHEERSLDGGTDISATELNKLNDSELGVNYVFGSEGSQGRIDVGLKTQRLRYTTNEATTNVLESDTDTFNAGLTLSFTPDTRVQLQAVEVKNTFPTNAIQNRQDSSLLFGVGWSPTDILSGEINWGRSQNDLTNSSTGDVSLSTWNASVDWLVADFSTITFQAEKSAENTSNNVGSFVDTSELSITWSHEWSELLTMALSAQEQSDEYIGANRSDDTSVIGFELSYAMRQWLSLGLNIGVEERQSSDTTIEYEKNTIDFSIKASL